MPAKMRLQRHGKKGRPFYHIVIADGRAPRNGRFIEKVGTYNPLARPADIQIDFDRALYWIQNGVQPSDTVKAILSYKGLMYKNHLLKGVQKGAMTEEQAEAKFQSWLQEKEAKIQSKKNELTQVQRNDVKKRLEHEVKVNQAKSEAIAKKFAKEAAKESAASEEAMAEEAVAEVPVAEAPVAEVPVAEVPVAEVAVAEEAPVVEAAPEVVEESAPQAAATEETAPETTPEP